MGRITRVLVFLLLVLGITFSLCWGAAVPDEWSVTYSTNIAQTNKIVVSTPTATVALYITDIVIANGATAGNIKLLDGFTGTVIWNVYLAVNTTSPAIGLTTPIRLTVGKPVCMTSTTVTTHSVTINGIRKVYP